MNPVTNLLVLLIATSFILPASTIMYASGSPENSDSGDSSDTRSTDTSNDGSSTDNSGSSTGGGTTTTDNSGTTTGGSTGNSATLPITSTASNDTGNVQPSRVRISSMVSWIFTTESALLFQFRLSCGATSSPPTPRLGPIIWRRSQSSINQTPTTSSN